MTQTHQSQMALGTDACGRTGFIPSTRYRSGGFRCLSALVSARPSGLDKFQGGSGSLRDAKSLFPIMKSAESESDCRSFQA